MRMFSGVSRPSSSRVAYSAIYASASIAPASGDATDFLKAPRNAW
jgi:hypothetical protein